MSDKVMQLYETAFIRSSVEHMNSILSPLASPRHLKMDPLAVKAVNILLDPRNVLICVLMQEWAEADQGERVLTVSGSASLPGL